MARTDVSDNRLQSLESADRIEAVRGQLLRYCVFLSHSRDDAEDLVQTTLLKALPVLSGELNHPNLPALLRRIAKNTWLDEVRKQNKYDFSHLDEWSECLGSSSLPDTSLLEEALQVLVHRLTPQQRTVMLLCEVFRYADKEVAKLLGISHGAVKAALHRARLRLQPFTDGDELPVILDESQQAILKAYVSAFQNADIRMLVQLCEGGVLDSVQATSRVLTFARGSSATKKTNGDLNIRMLAAA